MSADAADSLRARLDYDPVPLAFGTSGRRGLVVHLTQLEIYINARAELEYLLGLTPAEGGLAAGQEFYLGCDLRPSSSRFVAEEQGRGEIAQAIARAVADTGLRPVNLGCLPTPALTNYALQLGRGSIMITGSHIPFERNGYKTNSAMGELRKVDEAPIQRIVEQVRHRLDQQPFAESLFDQRGQFKTGHGELPPETSAARDAYLMRYLDFFAGRNLRGKRILVYQHSAVGRDMLVELLRTLGAEVIPAGRSDTFVPIDTENMDAAQLAAIQSLVEEAGKQHGALDAVVSTDGDSDRPLILGVEPAAAGQEGPSAKVRFYGGDLVGMLVAEYLGADAVVVPISCNDALDRGALQNKLEPKTRIGSPFVIAGMEAARGKGRRAICGWEANGGFLTGSDITKNGRLLTALPTRDAFLPILAILFQSAERSMSLRALFDTLPARFSRAALLKKFPRPASLAIVKRFSPSDARVTEIEFPGFSRVMVRTAEEQNLHKASDISSLEQQAEEIRGELSGYFPPALGFGAIQKINYTDGVRIYFDNGDVAHVRPSGNADELRIYAVADSQARADAIANAGVAEPDGILRRLEKSTAANPSNAAASSEQARIAAAVANAFHPKLIEEQPAAREAQASWIRFKSQPGLVRLQGTVQHYDWGGHDFIPALLGQPHPSPKPCAELWMGTHPGGTTLAGVGIVECSLAQLIEFAPVETLGPDVAARFHNQLPYLFKVLDARKMLSIQAHPTLEQAAEGFEKDHSAGIELHAPHRNYKDRNHKPEVHVALTPFWMLHGFRPLEEIAATLHEIHEFHALMPDFGKRLQAAGTNQPARQTLLRDLYQTVMTLPQERVDALIDPLLDRLRKSPPASKDDPRFWALRAAENFPLLGGHRDRGILSIFLLNLVRLAPGQGTFQPAGTLHAYLEGVNMELMANSDNVLRGGLTPKHIDVPELLRVLQFDAGKPEIINGEAVSAEETVYATPAAEFKLSRLTPGSGHSCQMKRNGPQILIVLEGAATARAREQVMELQRGQIMFVPHQLPYKIEAKSEPTQLFLAAVP